MPVIDFPGDRLPRVFLIKNTNHEWQMAKWTWPRSNRRLFTNCANPLREKWKQIWLAPIRINMNHPSLPPSPSLPPPQKARVKWAAKKGEMGCGACWTEWFVGLDTERSGLGVNKKLEQIGKLWSHWNFVFLWNCDHIGISCFCVPVLWGIHYVPRSRFMRFWMQAWNSPIVLVTNYWVLYKFNEFKKN